MPKIFINPGHGPKNNGVFDPGAVGPTGTRESDIVLDIGKRVEQKLRDSGWVTKLYQDGDLTDVSNAANAWGSHYFVSIHCNSSVMNRAATGIETYCLALGGQGERLAGVVQAELIRSTGMVDRGVKTANYQVLRDTNAPAILVEVGFISNPTEEKLLKSNDFKEKVAAAIVTGINKFAGVKEVTVVVENKSLKERLSNDDTYLTVRVREGKVEQAIKEINKLGYAAKRLDLA